MTDAILLFAAGFGTRMRHLTADRPKPLVPVAGKPLIEHALDQVRGFGPLKTVVNAHYHAEQIIDHFAGTDVTVLHEVERILDTGGGLRAALPYLGAGPVFTLNTDAVWQGANPLTELAQAWRPDEMDALMLCVPQDRAIGHAGRGDVQIAPDGRLRFGAGPIYSGLQIIKPETLDRIDKEVFSLKDVWLALEPEGRLFGTLYSGRWCDVGSPEGVALAEQELGHV